MEERTQSFDEKLTLLLEEAKKKKNVLENREILDFFKGEILDPDKLDPDIRFSGQPSCRRTPNRRGGHGSGPVSG